ncbi:MAG: hypothetical protein ACRDD1_14785, partial [Planctomycetia bacterium]
MTEPPRPAEVVERTNAVEARRWAASGLALLRNAPASPVAFRRVLAWMRRLAALGVPLPPAGVVGDLGHVLLGLDAPWNRAAGGDGGLSAVVRRQYEDHLLHRLPTEPTLRKAA